MLTSFVFVYYCKIGSLFIPSKSHRIYFGFVKSTTSPDSVPYEQLSNTMSSVKRSPALGQSTDQVSTVSYHVESILAHQYTTPDEPIRYFIKWKNYPAADSSWEPESNLMNCEEILKDYWDKEISQGSPQTPVPGKSQSVQRQFKRSGKCTRPTASKKRAARQKSPSTYAVADSTTTDLDHEPSAVTGVRSAAAGPYRSASGHVVYNGEHCGNGTKSHDQLQPGDELQAYEAGDILLTLYEDNGEVTEFMGVVDPDDPDVELMVPVDQVYSGNWALDPSFSITDDYNPYEPIPVVPVRGGPIPRQ